jgi:hypothetical protein
VVLRPAVLLAGALAHLVSWAELAVAAPAPDSAAMTRIQSACDAAKRVRITTEHGIQEATRPAVDAGGVILRAAGRPALLTVGEVRDPDRRIPWSDVVKLESERTRAAQGALLFGTLVLIPTAVSIATHGPDAFEAGDNVGIWFSAAAVLAGVGLGALIGATQPTLHRIYP